MTEAWLLSRAPEVLFLSLILSAARPLAFIFILPLFTRFGLQQGLIQGGILVAFAAPVFPGVSAELQVLPPIPVAEIAFLIAKELLVGVILGLALGLPLWAVVAAGDVVDMQRGASMGTLVDPGTGEDTTLTGTLFFLVTALVLITSGWFTEVLLSSLYGSYVGWPILQTLPPLSAEAGAEALGLLDALLRTGVILAMPILAPLLLAEIALGLAGRYTQQINVMFVAMSLKQVIYILILPIYFSALIVYVQGEIRDLGDTPTVLEGFLNP
ncbi:MAG: type III secretion system export apparatus subunit SctT [Pseudomonadota bacterium]